MITEILTMKLNMIATKGMITIITTSYICSNKRHDNNNNNSSEQNNHIDSDFAITQMKELIENLEVALYVSRCFQYTSPLTFKRYRK